MLTTYTNNDNNNEGNKGRKEGRKDWVASHSSSRSLCTLRNHTFRVRLLAIFCKDKYDGGIGWLKSYFTLETANLYAWGMIRREKKLIRELINV